METRTRVSAVLDILLGMTMFITEYAAIVMYNLPMDLASSGLWGGMFVMVTGVVIIKRHNVLVLTFAILSVMSGILLIALYIWSFTWYSEILSSGYTCDTTYLGHSVCSRIALDSLFLIYGVAALSINTILIHDAKWIEPSNKHVNSINGHDGPAAETTLRNIPVVVTITPSDNGQNILSNLSK